MYEKFSMTNEKQQEIQEAVQVRRNFAIISHPDAGKTTLTEKLLLYGGAIHQAGAVKARRDQRKVTSDWMEMEKQRGISITSTVLQFKYQGFQINLLDTPGHQDFSEDTYRTLAAADNAVMLIDAAKGLENQTKKLFEVCRLRKLPIFTFINKMDRPGRDPLELLDEIEQELGLKPYVVNWPIGTGDSFKGVYNRSQKVINLFKRSAHGSQQAEVKNLEIESEELKSSIEPEIYSEFRDSLEILEELGNDFDLEKIHSGGMTPVFFGSAMTNFGVQPFLEAFLKYALKPDGRNSSIGIVDPTYPEFSGFIFKLQANMDPKHRDRVAFIRVCTGKFQKDMIVNHARTGKTIRLSRPQKLFAQDRSSVEEAFGGDVIGLNNPGMFAIGDTIYSGQKLEYEGIPCFSPEFFSYLKNLNPSKFKQFQKGIHELKEEGAIQIMHSTDGFKRDPILAAVGRLQFEVVQFRILSEYGVDTTLESIPFEVARWVKDGWKALEKIDRVFNAITVKDSWDRPVLLFKNKWALQQVITDHPELKLDSVAPVGSGFQPS